jgi:murein DD-endopeptidase MepM/ murein hydrolase activator NlpD
MQPVPARLTAALVLACLGVASAVLVAGATAAPPIATVSTTAADGYAAVVIGPDGSTLASTQGGGFAYPADGSIVSVGSSATTLSPSPSDGTAYARSELTDVALFGGEITVSSLQAAVSSSPTVSDFSDSGVTNLIVLGQSVSQPSGNLGLALGDWGSMTVLRESTTTSTGLVPSSAGSVTGLAIHLDADHFGLLRGSTILIGHAEASAQAPEGATTTTTGGTTTTSTATGGSTTTKTHRTQTTPSLTGRVGFDTRAADAKRSHGEQTVRRGKNGLPVRTTIPDVTPKLTASHYVFPVYGPSAYGDTFGAPRGDVSGGWHHGDDIFAPLGAPILAVADGTVFSVGWNDVGGWRLWLRDHEGNEFYYAHLSAYTALAVNGRRVHGGDVLGFVGNTGDASTTPFHLHFEVHPVSLLFLGYDGAVNPTKYLDAWKRLEDVRIRAAVPFVSLPGTATSDAPAPGAILLESSDISTANGLDPDSLRRAMSVRRLVQPTTKGSVADLPVPLPVLDRA